MTFVVCFYYFFYFYPQVYDGATDQDPVIGTYCTTTTPPPLITSGHAATLLFHSDYSVQDSGFNIAYSAIPGTYLSPRSQHAIYEYQ
jgi:hypothetical protein